MSYDDLMLSLRNNDVFMLHLKNKLFPNRPVVPPHNPKEDNTEVWKARSAEQRGFDLALSILKIQE